MLIRQMTVDDVVPVAAIEARAAGFPWPPSQFVDSYTNKNFCLVLEEEDRLLGFAIFSIVLDEANLLNIAVNPIAQGRGFGRALLVKGIEHLISRNVGKCFLEVRVGNTSAQNLYLSLGFQKVGERRDYYPAQGGREDALVMCREFGAVPLAVV